MTTVSNAEAGVATGSPRLSWRGQGEISGAACAQKSSSTGLEVPRQVENRGNCSRVDEAAGAKGPTGPPTGPPLIAEKEHQDKQPSPEVHDGTASGGEGWRLVRRRWRRRELLDRRSLIVWGLPARADAGRFAALLKTKATCWWRGRGHKRHMVIEFATPLALGAHEQSIRCLLYTSPSPRDRSLSRMPSSA